MISSPNQWSHRELFVNGQTMSLIRRYQTCWGMTIWSLWVNTDINKLDPPDNHNTRSTKIWNIITPNLKIFDYSVSISCLKSKLKSSLLANQHCHAVYDWTNKDFDICNLKNFVGSCRDSTWPPKFYDQIDLLCQRIPLSS